MAILNLRDSATKYTKVKPGTVSPGAPDTGERRKSVPLKAEKNQYVGYIQQFLVNRNYPTNKRNATLVDYVFGPTTNSALVRFVEDQIALPANHANQDNVAIAKAMKPYVSINPEETFGNIKQLAGIIQSKGAAPSQTQPGLKQDQGVYFVDVDGVKFPIGKALESIEHLDYLLQYTGMISPSSKGQQRSQEIGVASTKIYNALLAKDLKGAALRLLEMTKILQGHHAESGKAVIDMVRSKFALYLSRLEPGVKTSLENDIVDYLKTKNIADQEGNLRSDYLWRAAGQDIDNYIRTWFRYHRIVQQ